MQRTAWRHLPTLAHLQKLDVRQLAREDRHRALFELGRVRHRASMNGVRESLTQTLGCSPHQDWAMEFASEVKALGTTVRERAPEDVAAGGLGDSFALNLNTYYPLMRVSAVRLQ